MSQLKIENHLFKNLSNNIQKIPFLDDIENFSDTIISKNEEKSSNCATFWNICNTIQGLPILTIPYVVFIGGWYSILSIIIVAFLTDYTCILLYKSIKTHNENYTIDFPYPVNSYEDLGEIVFGDNGRKLIGGCMFLQTLFISSIYPFLIGEILMVSFSNIYIQNWLWILIGGIIFIPNAFIKNLEQVSWTSIITVLSAKIIFIILIVYSFQQSHKWNIANLTDFNLVEFPGAIGIILSCYLAQPFIPSIYSNMIYPNNFKNILHFSITFMTLINIIVGILCDAVFRPHTKQPITNNMPDGYLRIILNIIGAILSITSYTLPIYISFGVFERFLNSFLETERLYSERSIFEPHKLFLVLLSILMASFIPLLPLLLGLICSTAGIGLEFILPPIIYLKICYKNTSKLYRIWIYILCGLGLFLMIGCLIMTGIAFYKIIIINLNEI